MYSLWRRNGLWAALESFPTGPKPTLGLEAPGQAGQVAPDQATEKILTLGSLLAVRKEDSSRQRGVGLCRPGRQLGMDGSVASSNGAGCGQPGAPFLH